MTHTYAFHDGLETQDTSRWSSATGGAVELTTVSLSRASRRFNVAGATGTLRNLLGAPVTPWGFWTSLHINFTSLPAAGQFLYLQQFVANAAPRAAVRINGTTGLIELYAQTTATWEAGVSAYAVQTGVWYVLSMKCFSGNISPQFVLRLRDTGATVDSKTQSGFTGNLNFDYLEIGPYAASTGNSVYDNVVVEGPVQGNVDDPVNQLTTRYACGTLIPTSAGAWDQWTGTFADVDDTPNDGDATVRTENAQNEAFTQGLPPTTSLVAQVGEIYSVEPFAILKAVTGALNAQLRLRTESTDTDTANSSIGTGAYVVIQAIYMTDPATASNWTVSVIDGAEVGVERTSIAGNVLRCTLCGLDILYTVGVIQRTRKTSYFIESYDPEKRIIDLQGHEVPYNEVRSNRWLRLLRKGLPTSQEEESYFDMEDMFYVEGLTYEQQWGQEPRLQLKGPDDFVADLIDKITKAGAGGL